MTDPAGISKESIKSLGPGAFLVTALPSIVLVLSLYAFIASRLFPGADPLEAKDGPVDPGLASVLHVTDALGVTGGVLLALGVLCVAVILRPMQITLVQVLEGYWAIPGRNNFVEGLAVERHVRRRFRAAARSGVTRTWTDEPILAELARQARRDQQADRLEDRAAATLARYPLDARLTMPTSLGNVLRRAEGIAGERYGLSTVHTYPRLYPHLSPRLESEIGNQLDVLDSTATFTLLFLAETALTLPLLLRWDWWSWVPALFLLLAAGAYAGAVRAAQKQGNLLEVAFDLHRFDLLKALHLPLPADPARELKQNRNLARFFAGPRAEGELRPPAQWRYRHPQDQPVEAPREQIPGAGGDGSKEGDAHKSPDDPEGDGNDDSPQPESADGG